MRRYSINVKIVIVVFTLLLINSCHSKFISLGNQICRNPAWNDSKTAVTFVALQTASRAPIGIAKFPDGGRYKVVYSNLGLYIYKLNSDTLVKLTDLKELTIHSKNNIKFKLAIVDSLVYYNVSFMRSRPNNSLTIVKYSKHKFYSINIKTKTINKIDSSVFFTEYNKHANSNKASLSETTTLVKNITYSNWGLVLKNIYPQSKNIYFEYLLEAKAGKAIFEQIVPEFSENDKKYIIKKMKDKQQKLLINYETTSKENDVYRKSLKKKAYLNYSKYFKDVKKKFSFPVPDDNVAVRNKVINSLKKLKINISNDFKIKEIKIIGKGYDSEFELKNADSTSIDKYKKWFYNIVAYLLNNKWGLSKQTIFEKPNSAGIINGNLININWEHTELKYTGKDNVRFINLSILSDIDWKHNFSFSVSEEIEDK